MQEDKAEQTQDVQIAVMTTEIKHMGQEIGTLTLTFSEKISLLTDQIKTFITIVDKKVDRDIYLDDKKQRDEEMKNMRSRLSMLDDFKKGVELGHIERKKIFGMTTGTLAIVIQVLSVITMFIALYAFN